MNCLSIKKILTSLAIGFIVLMLGILCACSNTAKNNGKIEVTDILGTKFSFDEPIKKIVSTHNPTLNHVVILGNGSSKYLAGFGNKDKADGLYKEVLSDWDNLTVIGGQGNPVNKETIIKLHPDLALVPENLAAMKDKDYEGTGVDTFVALPKVETIDTVTDSLKLIAKLFGEEERANTISDKYNIICNSAKNSVKDVKDSDKPKVLFMGSNQYSVATDDMIQTQIIENAGGINCAKHEFESGFFADTDAETIVKLTPEIIFVPNYSKSNVESILADEKLQNVPAVKNKKVYKFPCNLEPWDYPTCSVCLGLAWATNMLHPNLFDTNKLHTYCDEYYKLLYNKTFTPEKLGIN